MKSINHKEHKGNYTKDTKGKNADKIYIAKY
jgi:hypothetical protein